MLNAFIVSQTLPCDNIRHFVDMYTKFLTIAEADIICGEVDLGGHAVYMDTSYDNCM